MLSLLGAITLSKWLVNYLGWDYYEYHLFIEWIIVVFLIAIEEDINDN